VKTRPACATVFGIAALILFAPRWLASLIVNARRAAGRQMATLRRHFRSRRAFAACAARRLRRESLPAHG